jgi:hypothetical protein
MTAVWDAKDNSESKSRRKNLWGKVLAMKNGTYICCRGKENEHTIHIENGYVQNGKTKEGEIIPAVEYKDGHTESWKGGWPDGDNAVISDFGSYEEDWKDHQLASCRILDLVLEKDEDDE